MIPLCLLVYASLLALHGYHFASGDASETSASALHLDDDSLYQGDLYISHTSKSNLNERYPFVLLIHLLGASSAWSFFLLHFVCSMLVIGALYQLGKMFLKQTSGRLLFIISCLFVIYGYTLGENEIWYNYVMPSLPAKALGASAICLYLSHRRLWAYLVLIPASLCQPIAGAQVALILLVLDLWHLYDIRKMSWSYLLPPILYGCTAGLWILVVYLTQTYTPSEMSDERFFEIMELRLGHHFFPSYYPTSRWLVMMALLGTSLWVWSKSNKILYRFTIICISGYVFYFLAVEVFALPNLVVLQWFKTTVWTKAIGLLALIKWLESKLPLLKRPWVSQSLCLALALSIAVPSILPEFFAGKPYYFPWTKPSSPAYELAAAVQKLCPKDASIITPPEMTEIRYFARRGVFIDYKSNIHSRDYLRESQDRREKIYGLTLALKRSGEDVQQTMRKHYKTLPLQEILTWKGAGATHIITYADVELDLTKMYANESYSLYSL